MEEHEVIANTILYLINKQGAKITKVSTKEDDFIKKFLLKKRVPKKVREEIQFKSTGADIVARLWDGGKELVIEAKGGSVSSYKFYTSLGQLIYLKESKSAHYWFAFALPYSWREMIRKGLRDSDGNIKPIIEYIIKTYTRNGQGLYFYFVKDNGKVIPKTWRETLK